MQKAKRNTCPGRFAGRTEGLGGTELSVVSQEVVLHTQPTATGYIAAHTHKYGTGKLPIPLADGRTFTLDFDGLPRPEPDAGAR
ncbi:hypothetical protein ABZ465_24605 [Streptomyces griseoincarnatus]